MFNGVPKRATQMSQPKSNDEAPSAGSSELTPSGMGWWVLRRQGLVLLVVTTGIYIWKTELATSILIGGLVSLLSQAWFTFHVFARPVGAEPYKALKSLYSGEMGKLVLITVLFAAVFSVSSKAGLELVHIWVFIGFIITQSIVWFAPFFLREHSAQ